MKKELKRLFYVSFIAMLFLVYGFITDETKVYGKTYKLESGETTHVVINSNSNSFTYIRIPSSDCEYSVKITDIHVFVEGEEHSEYVPYVYADDVYDSGRDYYTIAGKITFNKNGKKDNYERNFLIDFDYWELYPILSASSNYIIECDISVEPAYKAKLSKTNITCYLDNIDGKAVKLKNASGKVKWSISNKKIAKIYREGNVVYIYPKKPGTCYLKAKCAGKTYKCKVKVKGRNNIYAGGYLKSYDTRNNVFIMKFKNCSNKTIKIKSGLSIAMNYDYEIYDRAVKLSRTVKVKPGKVKTLKFKVQGDLTWYDVNDFCLNYVVTYKGKSYLMASDDETTWIAKKQNGKNY